MSEEPAIDERLRSWNERHSAGDFEGQGPNPTFTAAVAGLRPGRALELACGSGTNAVWLSTRDWQVIAVDWSAVALANGRAKAEEAGVEVEWLERNLQKWQPDPASADLVFIVYLHLPREERRPVYAAAARAVAPNGRLVVIGHDRVNAAEGLGGPPDPDRLFTAEEIATDLLEDEPGLAVERSEVVRRARLPERAPIDALLVVRRVAAPRSAADRR